MIIKLLYELISENVFMYLFYLIFTTSRHTNKIYDPACEMTFYLSRNKQAVKSEFQNEHYTENSSLDTNKLISYII